MTLAQLLMTATGEVERPDALNLSRFPSVVAVVARFFAARDIDAYLVGGVVRDALLGRDTDDVDLAVDSDGGAAASDIASLLDGHAFPLDIERDIHRVVSGESGETVIDVSRLKGDILTDLGRRDFALDAMAVSVSGLMSSGAGGPIIDPHGGRGDLETGAIRAVSPTVFADDPGRLLRAARLEVQLGFTIAAETEASIKRQADLAATVSGERVRDELLNILAEPDSTASVRRLDELGLLSVVIPELDEARDVSQPKEHHWDVFGHSVETPGQVETLLTAKMDHGGFVKENCPRFDGMDAYFAQVAADGRTRLTLLKLAALLHDIGKPAARTMESSGRIRFIGHHTVGAEMARAILARLRLSGRGIDMVTRMVQHHLRPGQMAQGDDLPTPKATYKYYRDLDDVGIDTVYLNLADYVAARGPDLGEAEWAGRCRTAAHILHAGTAPVRQMIEPRLIDGDDIMEAFSLEPGPTIGTMLEVVREAEATGEIGSKEDALELVRSTLKGGGEGA